MSNLVWEIEYLGWNGQSQFEPQHHLKVAWTAPTGLKDYNYKVSVAWITRPEKRKWFLSFADGQPPKMFKTLKAAKAYAVAIVTLES